MAVTRLNAFLASLQAAELLSRAQLDEIRQSSLVRGGDPAPLAKDLVHRGWLTSYQVNQLLRGNVKELVLGPYCILDRLGEGGMGQVFKAYHKPLERIVALKVIRKERVSNPDAVKRFHREVQSTASLSHPNIIAACDAGQIAGTHYLAMELVEGTDLSKLVRKGGALAPEVACEYMRQAALGLQHAHEQGLVHRDIKPSNLLVAGVKLPDSGITKKGTAEATAPCVKVLDLGLARLEGSENQDNLTRIGCVVGTPDFLAPEQAKNSSTVDIRADLYSLGCTFFFLLSGQAPFRAESSTEVMLKHITDPIPSLEKFRGDVPAPVQAIIKKLMAKKPDDRFQTPAELAQALQPFCGNSRADAAGPPSSIVRKKKSAPPGTVSAATGQRHTSVGPRTIKLRRKPRAGGNKRAVALGAAVLLLSGAVALGMALYHAAPPEQGSAQATTKTGETTRRTTSPSVTTSPTKPTTKATPTSTRRPGTEVTLLTKPRTSPETKPDVETKPKPETKPQTKPKPELKPETKPERKPETKPERKPETKPEIKPKPETKPERRRLVVGERQVVEARAKIQRERQAELAESDPEDRRALARALIRESAQAKDDPARRYALLELAGDVGARGISVDIPLQTIDMLEKDFEIDGWKQRVDWLKGAATANAQRPFYVREILAKILEVADLAVAEDQYPAAKKLLAIAKDTAAKTQSKALIALVRIRANEIDEMQRRYPEYQPAAELRKENPADPQASTRWGLFVCLYKGRWDEGLPLLAEGDNEELKELAQRDLAQPKDVAEQLRIADKWYQYARRQPKAGQNQALLHAQHWYKTARPRVAYGSERNKVDQRVKDIDHLTGRDAVTERPDELSRPLNLMESRTLIELANTAYLEGHYDKSVKAYRHVLEKMPKKLWDLNPQVLYELNMAKGYLAMEQERFTEAVRDFQVALNWARKAEKMSPGATKLAQKRLAQTQAMGK